ncbi:MAG: BatA domain-containing protein, partial [Candidatus Edwardsbacteria bacterium]
MTPTFLNPLLLFALVLAGIPLIIHLFQRPKAKKLDFSSLTFLHDAKRRKLKRVRLQQLFLLIIRTLIIVFLILTLSRPAVKGVFPPNISTHPRTSVVVVLDNSYSMGLKEGIETRFEKAKKTAESIVDFLNPEDEAFFILCCDKPTVVIGEPTHNLQSLREAIREAKLSFQTTDFKSSLEKAYSLLTASKNLCKEIYLVTDLQKEGFKLFPLERLDSKVRLYLIAVGQENTVENASISHLDWEKKLPLRGMSLTAGVSIKNYGALDLESMVSLYLHNKKEGTASLHLKGREEKRVNFTITP